MRVAKLTAHGGDVQVFVGIDETRQHNLSPRFDVARAGCIEIAPHGDDSAVCQAEIPSHVTNQLALKLALNSLDQPLEQLFYMSPEQLILPSNYPDYANVSQRLSGSPKNI